MKRKALLGPSGLSTSASGLGNVDALGNNGTSGALGRLRRSQSMIHIGNATTASGLAHRSGNAMVNVVSEMEANKVSFGEHQIRIERVSHNSITRYKAHQFARTALHLYFLGLQLLTTAFSRNTVLNNPLRNTRNP
jgi:hypothetical protein